MRKEFPRNLRYSPVNFLIVNWGYNGSAFNDCGLPEPQPCPEPPKDRPEVCQPLPIREAIDTVGWAQWLPEVIVGIEDPDEEIAASYVREAAIDFAKYTRVLQRQILIPLQPGVCTYPVEPYDQENIIGVIGVGLDRHPAISCSKRCSGKLPNGIGFTLDVARNELHLESHPGSTCCTGGHKVLRLLVWAAPTEDACEHDKFLYEMFRRDIAVGARFNYATTVHFRDRGLMFSMRNLPDFEMLKAKAKNKALSRPSATVNTFGSGMWGNNTAEVVR